MTSIIVDNLYGSKFINTLEFLFRNSLFIESSVEGQKMYDIYQENVQKMKKLYFINKKNSTFKDYYRDDQNSKRSKSLINEALKMGKYFADHQFAFIKPKIQKDLQIESNQPIFNSVNFV